MRRKANLFLACALVLIVFGMFLATMAFYGRNYAYGFFVSYRDSLPENPTLMDNIRARIAKLDYNATQRLFLRQPIREANAALQARLGRNMISIGLNNMVRLKCGAYYNLFTGAYDMDEVRALSDFAREIREEDGIPTLFVYCHAGLYEDGQLPPGMDGLDNNLSCADDIVRAFEEAGVPVADSREAYRQSGLTIDEAINKSDVHWTHRMALETARYAAARMNEVFGLRLDADALDYDRFLDETHESLLMGEYGRRIGFRHVTPDDVHVLTPAYETDMLYEELNTDVSRKGSFREAVLTPENLTRDEESGFSENAYYIYGHYLTQTHTVNKSAADMKVLVFKDSYGTPVASFLGLAAADVTAVDLRSTDLSMREWVDKVQPDVVLFAYSQQMMRRFEYVIA